MYTEHLEACSPFNDLIYPFFVKYVLASITDFDAETKDMDEETAASDNSWDISLDR